MLPLWSVAPAIRFVLPAGSAPARGRVAGRRVLPRGLGRAPPRIRRHAPPSRRSSRAPGGAPRLMAALSLTLHRGAAAAVGLIEGASLQPLDPAMPPAGSAPLGWASLAGAWRRWLVRRRAEGSGRLPGFHACAVGHEACWLCRPAQCVRRLAPDFSCAWDRCWPNWLHNSSVAGAWSRFRLTIQAAGAPGWTNARACSGGAGMKKGPVAGASIIG